MSTVKKILLTGSILLPVLLTVACAVVSEQVRSEALSGVSFPALLDGVERYKGQTVVLGGYILETRHTDAGTVMEILQAPLGFGQEPAGRDRSQGRILLHDRRFLDPEVYRKDRLVTVAGKITGVAELNREDLHTRYLVLENRELYLWPELPDPYPYYDPWYYRPWYGYPPPYYYYPSSPYYPYYR
jgi:outer membrane lipoprotein